MNTAVHSTCRDSRILEAPSVFSVSSLLTLPVPVLLASETSPAVEVIADTLLQIESFRMGFGWDSRE